MTGAWAGFVNSAVVTPVELIKIRLQNQVENSAAQFNLNLRERLRSGLRSSLFERSRIYYDGPVDCIVKIYKEKVLFVNKETRFLTVSLHQTLGI